MALRTYEAETVTDLHHQLMMGMVTAREVDVKGRGDIQLHNILAQSETCNLEVDLKDYWLTKKRWTQMTREYLDRQSFEAFLNQCESRFQKPVAGTAFMRTRYVHSFAAASRVERSWGGCMLGIGFRMRPRPQITLHSRATHLGFLAPLDLAVAVETARCIGELIGFELDDISLVWHLEMAALQFKALPWFYKQGWGEDYLQEPLALDYPAHKIMSATYRQLQKYDEEGVLYGDMLFAPMLRLRRRWHAETKGVEFQRQFEGGTKRPLTLRKAVQELPHAMIRDLGITAFGEENDDLSGWNPDELE